MRLKEKIIKDLFKHECVKIGDFILKSGVAAPFYIDLRRIISFPSFIHLVTKAYVQLAKKLDFDCIAGIPTAALPFAAILSYTLKIPMIYPRIPKKLHGTGNSVEGHFNTNDRVLLLDDLITRGTSKQEALEILQKENLQIRDLIVLIRRSKEASKEMLDLKVQLHYFLDITEIIEYGYTAHYITQEQHKKIIDFL